jgi:hypothetical protein
LRRKRVGTNFASSYPIISTASTNGAKTDPKVNEEVNKQFMRCKHNIDGRFFGDPAISVIKFLLSFKKAADHNNIAEASAGLLLPYFMEGREKAGFSARMQQKNPSIII